MTDAEEREQNAPPLDPPWTVDPTIEAIMDLLTPDPWGQAQQKG